MGPRSARDRGRCERAAPALRGPLLQGPRLRALLVLAALWRAHLVAALGKRTYRDQRSWERGSSKQALAAHAKPVHLETHSGHALWARTRGTCSFWDVHLGPILGARTRHTHLVDDGSRSLGGSFCRAPNAAGLECGPPRDGAASACPHGVSRGCAPSGARVLALHWSTPVPIVSAHWAPTIMSG